jgi:hypothetical protein
LGHVEIVAHSHRCPNCGKSYQHNEFFAAQVGNVQAHICPHCRTLPPQIVYQDGSGKDRTGWAKETVYLSDGRQMPATKVSGTKWRIYKLPGSGAWFLVDQGPKTPVIYAKKIEAYTRTSENHPGEIPHIWQEAEGQIAVGDDGTVRFF